MSLRKYDILIIGSGPAGFSAAVRASQLGVKRIALIEKDLIGGTCLNCGCIPTKFLWLSLKTKLKIQKSYEYGIKAVLDTIDFVDVIKKKDKDIENIRKGMKLTLLAHSIDIINGIALFKNKNTIIVSDLNNDRKIEILTNKIIIATGTNPSIIEEFNFNNNNIINSTDILNLKKIPKNMLIVGGGAIGIEMATIFSGFGCRITLIEKENHLLQYEDFEISEQIRKNLVIQGVEVLTSYTKMHDIINKYEKILVVTGRAPNNILKFENVGIKTSEKGFIKTNDFYQTNISNIYAVGDIIGENLFAYTAQNDGIKAAENAVNGNLIQINRKKYIVPKVVFAMPQIASVKVNNFFEYKNLIIGKSSFSSNSRAFIEKERAGFAKCAIDIVTKKPIAFWIIGAHSDELINIASQILKNNITYISRETIFHPSFSEILLNAYEDAINKTIYKNKKDRCNNL